jgi:hypothetical protein
MMIFRLGYGSFRERFLHVSIFSLVVEFALEGNDCVKDCSRSINPDI